VFVRPRWRAQVAVAGAIALVAVWELTIPASNTANWQPEVAEAPYVEIDGDRVVIHTFVSFDFGPEGYVCISIETRMKKGQGYSAIAGLYRQYELYYVIGDERDTVRLRTNYRLEDVYLYHLIPATPERSRASDKNSALCSAEQR
jgi:hypothetical protein